jgi:squalene-hopene/tetraprenyl-beta-curcumene cyclase
MGITRSGINLVSPSSTVFHQLLDRSIEKAVETLQHEQHDNGYWCYELEADCTIPAEYILMMHFLDEIDEGLQIKLANYIRSHQNEEGGWPLYFGGQTDLSCTIKAYYALKLAGHQTTDAHMLKAKHLILSMGGAAKANVFTRIALAMFQQIPWRGVPFIPAEIMLFPKWFPFHLLKVSYWSRTVMVPLFILCSLKAKARNPLNIGIRELFVTPPESEKNYFPVRSSLNRLVLRLERVGFSLEPFIPGWIRKRALKQAESWMIERLNGESGLGAIFPAMVNAYEALVELGYDQDHPYRKTAKQALQKLLVIREDDAYCQPCVSPVWDTLLAVCALQETTNTSAASTKGLDWLKQEQLLDTTGDWSIGRPQLKPGGWPFQFKNDHYPDLDDTAFAAYAMLRSGDGKYLDNIQRAAEWTAGLQSKNGGFGAFDADNTHYYLNEIPFADHGALLDPPTSDVSGRCLMLLGQFKDDPYFADVCKRCYEYLLAEQEPDGSWFGRWGTNYIYGTWSVLIAFECYQVDQKHPAIQKAVNWLLSIQKNDGGWGEDNFSYHDPDYVGRAEKSTSFQTAWALLALMSAGEVHSEAVRKGIDYLVRHQGDDGFWSDPEFTAPGFPKVFYLKYHGYSKYFPLWALARYRNETSLNKVSQN